jgi:tetratricopeptide (TPR) repeat protein
MTCRAPFAPIIALSCFILIGSPAWGAPKPASAQAESDTSSYKANALSIELNEKAVLAVNARDFAGAEDLFKRSLAADSRNVTAVVNLAAMYLTNKKNPAAIALLEEYTSKYPEEASLQARLGDAYFASKQVKEATSAYERTLKIDPRYPNTSARLGTLYTLSRRLPDAERLFIQAAEEDPKNPQILSSLSSILLANGKPEMAVSTAKRALQIKPTKELYVTLGSAYEALKDVKNSVIAFERARDMGDNSPELKAKLETLRSALDKAAS